jgi:hypothetical protein
LHSRYTGTELEPSLRTDSLEGKNMKGHQNSEDVPASFRDPSGFLFKRAGSIYRQVNAIYKDNYEHLMTSGLYEALVKIGLLIPHEEIDIEPARPDKAYKIIKPELIEFISYPYEWCPDHPQDSEISVRFWNVSQGLQRLQYPV